MTHANDMIDTGQRKTTGGQTMSFIHNRMGAVTLAVAATVLLLGAGCSKAKPTAPAATAPSSDAQATADATANLPTEWAEYRSEKLGITIPYPEGWYVRENQVEGVTTILIDPAPFPQSGAGSDAPIRVVVTVTALSLEDALAAYESATTAEVLLGSTRAVKVEYRSELGGEPSYHETYHWNAVERLFTVDGTKNDAVVAYIANALAVQKE